MSNVINGLETKYAELNGVSDYKEYTSGELKTCILSEENRMKTPVGELIPQYKTAEYGERQKKYRSSVAFHKNGELKSVALNHQMPIKTPLGVYDAELVTFYEDGSINRLFPLNGKIDAYWGEDKEGEIAEKLDFDLAVGRFSAKVIAIHFYPSGALKSLTFWPGEKVEIETPNRRLTARIGFSLYEDGTLRSVEPASPTPFKTPIGNVLAYDTDALGINGDYNSLSFTKEGNLSSITTAKSGLKILDAKANETVFEPYEIPSIIDENETMVVPIKLDFLDDTLELYQTCVKKFKIAEHEISTFTVNVDVFSKCSICSSCESCSDCG